MCPLRREDLQADSQSRTAGSVEYSACGRRRPRRRPSHRGRGAPISRPRSDFSHRTRMPRPKPSAPTGTAELNATIARVAPAVLGLLADGVPRTRAAVAGALAGRHDAEDVRLALIRLAVTEQVRETGG